MRIFAVNPGSTSTKIALFEDDTPLFSANVSHNAEMLNTFPEISDQFEYRKDTILREVDKAGYTLQGVSAFVGRGGGLVSLAGGTYAVNDILLSHARLGFTVKHPAMLGAQLAHAFAVEYGGEAFVVNPPDVDELIPEARVTGWRGVYRESRIHALNQKEIGIRFAKAQGKRYEDLNLIICHIGGGTSITAHCKGRMIDSNDIANGDGPMAPTRCGTLPVKDVITACFHSGLTEQELRSRVNKNGGLVDHLGTSDMRAARQMEAEGGDYAHLIINAMTYQIGKFIGSMACAMAGKVDAVICTGGVSHDRELTTNLERMCGWIAPFTVMAGEFEMEALAAGALRVLRGEEKAKNYTGVPIWNGFPCEPA